METLIIIFLFVALWVWHTRFSFKKTRQLLQHTRFLVQAEMPDADSPHNKTVEMNGYEALNTINYLPWKDEFEKKSSMEAYPAVRIGDLETNHIFWVSLVSVTEKGKLVFHMGYESPTEQGGKNLRVWELDNPATMAEPLQSFLGRDYPNISERTHWLKEVKP